MSKKYAKIIDSKKLLNKIIAINIKMIEIYEGNINIISISKISAINLKILFLSNILFFNC